jgi:hypothetical protein
VTQFEIIINTARGHSVETRVNPIGEEHDECSENIIHSVEQLLPLVRAIVINQQNRWNVDVKFSENARTDIQALMEAELSAYALISQAETVLADMNKRYSTTSTRKNE